MFPLHHKPDKQTLTKTWVVKVLGRQPITSINSYFGAEIATYFGWMGFYTASLTIPALTGLLQYTYQYHYSLPSHHIHVSTLLLSFLNFVWVSFFLLAWSSIHDKIVSGEEEEEEGEEAAGRRLQFRPGGWVPQKLKQVVSVVITGFMFVVLILNSYGILRVGFMMKESLLRNNEFPGLPKFIKGTVIYLPEIILSLSLIGFNVIYTLIATKLTKW